MHLPTVLYVQFAGNNLVHTADQIMNSHVEEFICSRSAFQSVAEGGDDNRLVTGGQRWWLHKDTRHSDQAASPIDFVCHLTSVSLPSWHLSSNYTLFVFDYIYSLKLKACQIEISHLKLLRLYALQRLELSSVNPSISGIPLFSRYPPAMNEQGPVAFGNEPFFGALAVALPDLAPDFGGDLLTLTVLDLFASRYSVPFSLSKVWEKLLNASEVARYIIRCGKGYQIDIVDGALASELESRAQSSLSRQQDLKARSSLVAVLQDMITELDADDADDILAGEIYGRSPRAPDPDYKSEAYYEHQEMLSRDAYRNDWKKRVERAQEAREKRAQEQHVRRKTIELGLETATHGPGAHFRIDLCREGMIEPGTTRANEKSSGLEDEEGRHLAADSQGISMPPVEGDVRFGALSSSDGSERWDYGRHDDFFDDDDDRFYGGDDDSESPRDYTACTLDDCGYCGHCQY